jgi:hypothetical protein
MLMSRISRGSVETGCSHYGAMRSKGRHEMLKQVTGKSGRDKRGSKRIAWVVTLAMALSAFAALSMVAYGASDGTTIDLSDENPSMSGTGWTYNANIYTITDGADVTVTGSTTSKRIVVAGGANADITLSNAEIRSSSNIPFSITGATVDITLDGTNSLMNTSANHSYQCAGLQVAQNSKLIITEESTGSLEATSGMYGAAIGDAYNSSGCNFAMNGNGVVFANRVSDNTSKTQGVLFIKKYGKLPTPKSAGYKFSGWYTKKSAVKKIEIKGSANAYWYKVKYKGKTAYISKKYVDVK